MAKLDYFLLCESVINGPHGVLTIVNIFDAFEAAQFPTSPHPKIALTFSFMPETKDFDADGNVPVTLELIRPNDKVLIRAQGKGIVQTPTVMKVKSQSTLDLAGQVVFLEEGPHTARLFINGKLVSSRVLMVEKKGD